MKYKARKNGNAITVTIPSYICNILNIQDGDKLEVKLQGKKILIEKEEK